MEGPDSLVCKSITAPSPEVSVTKREVTSYKSMFGNVDRVNEIVDPGAFLDSIGPKGRLAKGQVTTRHNHKDLVGKMIHAEETSEGLLTTDKYGSDPVSDRVFSLVRDSIITTSSGSSVSGMPSINPCSWASSASVRGCKATSAGAAAAGRGARAAGRPGGRPAEGRRGGGGFIPSLSPPGRPGHHADGSRQSVNP